MYSGTEKILLFIQEDWKLILCMTIIFCLYFYYTNTFDYFEKKGIKYMKPKIILGNLGPRVLMKTSFHDFQIDIFNYFKGQPFGGIFEGRRPVLYILDHDLIKDITIRDFEHFVDRNSFNSREPQYIKRFLINLKGNEWKGVRSSITPSFNSARLKNMLPLIQSCADQMVQFLKQHNKEDVEMKNTMGYYTLDIIGTCAFGIKFDTFSNENSHFNKMALKFNSMSTIKRILIFFMLLFTPFMFKYINISFLNAETAKELVGILKVAKSERRMSKDKKSDFLQLLIDAADKEKCDSEDKSKTYLDDNTVDAQSLLFILAGYETSSTLLSFAIHVLATKPEIQNKLRASIEEITNGKEMSFEILNELVYLEGFLLETLRMYPPVARIDRVCTKKYTLRGTSVDIDVGDIVSIPVSAIHMDPTIYSDPHVFKPERFLREEKKDRPSHLFLAFGAGPRNCIGTRFAMLTVKMAMVSLLKNFKFAVCSKTEDPVKLDKKSVLLKPTGLWVRIEIL